MRGRPAARHVARLAVDTHLGTSQGLAATTRRPCRRVAGLLTPGNGPRGGFFAVRAGYELGADLAIWVSISVFGFADLLPQGLAGSLTPPY